MNEDIDNCMGTLCDVTKTESLGYYVTPPQITSAWRHATLLWKSRNSRN